MSPETKRDLMIPVGMLLGVIVLAVCLLAPALWLLLPLAIVAAFCWREWVRERRSRRRFARAVEEMEGK